MKLFLDSVNLEEIEACLDRGLIKGITCNPSIIAGASLSSGVYTHIHAMLELVMAKAGVALPVSVELTTTGYEAMLAEADQLQREFSTYSGLVIKVPIGWEELRVIHALRHSGMRVNCTCCMSTNQCIAAAQAGSEYVSVFWGRIRDTGYDAASVVRDAQRLLSGESTQMIVGSIRQMIDINEAVLAGADIVTAPFKFFAQMCQHPKTDETVAQFMRDARLAQHV